MILEFVWKDNCERKAMKQLAKEKNNRGNFYGSTVVKTPHFNTGCAGPIPGWGTKSSHAAQHEKKLKRNDWDEGGLTLPDIKMH